MQTRRVRCAAPRLGTSLTRRFAAPRLSQALAKLIEPAFAWAARRYQVRLTQPGPFAVRCPKSAVRTQGIVGTELKKYGLRYDDLLDPTNNLDVNEAMNRLPQQVCGASEAGCKRLRG